MMDPRAEQATACYNLSDHAYWLWRAIGCECATYAVAAEHHTSASISRYLVAREEARERWETLVWVMFVRAN